MKFTTKRELTFGEFIVAAYKVWGAKLAKQMVQTAVDARVIVFRGRPQFMTSSGKGRSL